MTNPRRRSDSAYDEFVARMRVPTAEGSRSRQVLRNWHLSDVPAG